jgi:hypothetical protein
VFIRSEDCFDGAHEELSQKTFFTKREAEAYREREYGTWYRRKDLRRYPHGWRKPKVVRATLTLEVNKHD